MFLIAAHAKKSYKSGNDTIPRTDEMFDQNEDGAVFAKIVW